MHPPAGGGMYLMGDEEALASFLQIRTILTYRAGTAHCCRLPRITTGRRLRKPMPAGVAGKTHHPGMVVR